jgi:hypothetical protein
MREIRTPIIALYFNGFDVKGKTVSVNLQSEISIFDLRSNEKELVSIEKVGVYQGTAIYDLRRNNVL